MAKLKDFYMMILSYLLKYDSQGFKDRFTNDLSVMDINYDFIIVGGGSAGSILANRLSENPDWKILLIEAGGEENSFSRTPAAYFSLQRSPLMDWNYNTTKQKNTCFATDGICSYPRGKVLGGSSSTNAILYTRGYKSDYDHWASLGNTGWDFKSLEKYFPDLPQRPKSSLKKGRIGQMSIEYPKFRRSIAEDFMKIGLSMGFKMGDCHDSETNCIEYPYNTMLNGSRCSTARAFLEPLSRKNLKILKKSIVTRVLIANKSAKGVEILHNRQKFEVFASKEVILSAGAIDSPKLLMLSGIGPKEHLEKLGIRVKADLPVGENLQDHNRIGLFIEVNMGETLGVESVMDEKYVEEYVRSKSGPLTSTGIDALSFVNVGKNTTKIPNIEYHITTFVGHPTKSLVAVSTTVLRPESQGRVLLSSTDPLDAPLIDPNYYSKPIDHELSIAGLRYSLGMFMSKEFRKYKPKLNTDLQPLCSKYKGQSFLNCLVEFYTNTNYHPVGTAAMGKKGVVDNYLKVHGISKLRVIDASIAPKIISANTNSMAMVIAEKGSDLIINDYTQN